MIRHFTTYVNTNKSNSLNFNQHRIVQQEQQEWNYNQQVSDKILSREISQLETMDLAGHPSWLIGGYVYPGQTY